MKLLSPEQIRAADAYTIEHEPVTSLDLMERAAKACALRIAELTPATSNYYIFCGQGNNGGDGLAIARLLAEMKRRVMVWVVEHSPQPADDFKTNLGRLKQTVNVDLKSVRSKDDLTFQKEKENTFGIDALLGTGLNKPIEGILADVIDAINNSGIPVISIDIPSGLFCNEKPNHTHIIKAQRTLTFQRPKLNFLFSDFTSFVGDFEVLDIGLDEPFIESQESPYNVIHPVEVATMIERRGKFSHKGIYGHALLLAGSEGKTGAAVLAARACLRSGAGLLTCHLPANSLSIMQTALPEAMVSKDHEKDFISSFPHKKSFDAIAMGPGIGQEKETAQALKLLIQNVDCPLVLDADALNLLAENKTWLAFLPPQTILTPHPKEFDRLAGAHSSDLDRLLTCRDFAHKYNVIVVLKGAFSAIVLPDKKVFFNTSGNPALAKGGSGDTLTGMILGLLAQGYDEVHAAVIAVYVHGYAADLYVKNNNEKSMLASDLIELLPKAFNL